MDALPTRTGNLRDDGIFRSLGRRARVMIKEVWPAPAGHNAVVAGQYGAALLAAETGGTLREESIWQCGDQLGSAGRVLTTCQR